MKIKATISTLLCLMISFMQIVSAQYPCDPATAATNLDVNNVNATITNGANLWGGSYVVPKPSASSGLPEISAIAGGGIWIGGFDPGGNIKLAATTFGVGAGGVDYYPGPLTESGETSLNTCNNFDYIWSITGADIASHRADWWDNGTIDGPIPSSVLRWPARGNPDFSAIFGFELPATEQGAAPFQDRNNDGLYSPYDGDYPDINGADQAHWMVFNDTGNEHFETGGIATNFEIQVLAYSFESNEPAVNNATFYDYKFINRGIETLEDLVIGIWIDPALGCPADDYVGCFPENDIAFIYNQDAIDGENDCSCPGGVNTYCEEIPVVGVKIVKGISVVRVFGENGELEIPESWESPDTVIRTKMNNFMVWDGPVVPSGSSLDFDYYSLLTGNWTDGTPLTTGGNGYNPGSTDYTNFAYSGNPSIDTAWSMCSENTMADPQMLMGFEPFRLEPGAVNDLTFAVIYTADVAYPCPDLSVLQEVGDEIDDFFNKGFSTEEKTPIYKQSSLTLSPNPFTNQTQLRLVNQNEQLSSVQVYSISGQLIRTYNSLSANSLAIEKGNLTTGMYFYKALSKDGKAYSGKFVVN